MRQNLQQHLRNLHHPSLQTWFSATKTIILHPLKFEPLDLYLTLSLPFHSI